MSNVLVISTSLRAKSNSESRLSDLLQEQMTQDMKWNISVLKVRR